MVRPMVAQNSNRVEIRQAVCRSPWLLTDSEDSPWAKRLAKADFERGCREEGLSSWILPYDDEEEDLLEEAA